MKKLLSFLVVGLIASPIAFSAVTAYSPPVGGSLITLPGSTVVGVPKVTTFSLPLRLPVSPSFVGRSRGTLTAVSATVFTDSQGGWTASSLSAASAPYFVRIRSGSAAGTWWQVSSSTANTATTLTILNRGFNPASLGVAVGDRYEIVPGDTLASFFGSLAATIGGTSAATADIVRVYDGATWREYYFNTSVSKWREGSTTFDRSNTVIRPDSGVVFARRSSGNLTLAVTGTVSDANERMAINATGVTFIGSVFPVARTLGSLNIQAMPGFVKNSGVLTDADKVTLFDGATWRTFNYNLANSQWREGTQTFNRNNFALPFGAPILIQRGAGASGGAVLLTLDIPYSL